ncbi:hypothetical protein Lal_00000872 [Lupinus albus]|nr:hypothetical protein Lal_00000872 [Lupinus albus]
MTNSDEDNMIGLMITNSKSNNLSELNRKIMLIGTVSLSVVILSVFAIHLYQKFVLRHQPRREASIHHCRLTVAHSHDRTEPRNTGLDPLLIKSLPMFILKKKGPHQQQREDHDDNGDECVVCLNAFDDEEMVRTKAEPRLEPQPREGPNGVAFHGVVVHQRL